MAARRQELETSDLDGLAKAFRTVAREEAEQVLKEHLPELLRKETRRPPQSVGQLEALEPYYKLQKVADITGYSVRTLARYVQLGWLRPCGPNRDRFAPAEVERLMTTPKEKLDRRAPANQADAEPDVEADVTAAVDRLLGGK